MTQARHWLDQILDLEIRDKVRIMNVCGGHERSVSLAGIRSALPKNIEIIPGPGCPVCICPEEDIYQAMQLALREKLILVAFGDMLRVPVNVPKGEPRSLVEARSAGADIRPVASPTEARRIAEENSDTPVVFFAAGFETTSAPVAAMLVEGVPNNLFVLLSGRLTWPAVALLLESDTPGFDCLIAPGHVATVMGPEEWEFVPQTYDLPAAIAGFSADSLLAASYSVLRQKQERKAFLDNCYQGLVQAGGNPGARRQLATAFEVVDADWRGIGMIPRSGFAIRPAFAAHDATRQFPDYDDAKRRRRGQMPPGCDCAKVVLGKIYPNGCRIFGTGCTPRHPVGPCMVSDEGACRIWWANGVRSQTGSAATADAELRAG
jgi:hydrogenase expression/formation protein HypD